MPRLLRPALGDVVRRPFRRDTRRITDLPVAPVPVPALGRRITDPADRPPVPDTLAVRGRLAGVSVRASVAAGAWVGFALGLTLGTGIGAIVVWLAGQVLDWQRDVALTFGVARRLLPFGDQIGLLRSVESSWYVVIPAAGVIVGAVAAVIGGLIGGLIAATYNRSPRHALVIVELPRAARDPDAALPDSEAAAEEERQEAQRAVAGRAPSTSLTASARRAPASPPEAMTAPAQGEGPDAGSSLGRSEGERGPGGALGATALETGSSAARSAGAEGVPGADVPRTPGARNEDARARDGSRRGRAASAE